MRADTRESIASLQGVAAGILRLEARLEVLSAAVAASAAGGRRAEASSGVGHADRGVDSEASGVRGASAADEGHDRARLGRQDSDVPGMKGAGQDESGATGLQDLVVAMKSADHKLDDISKRLETMTDKVMCQTEMSRKWSDEGQVFNRAPE